MKCPNCSDTTLVMADRQGVEIDYCPLCRGIWLDRGELDKLLDKAGSEASQARAAPAPTQHARRDDDDRDYRRKPYEYRDRKKSWLNEIFD